MNIAFHTLGCKLNYSETSAISKILMTNGYKIVDFKDLADVYVIHSCTVTKQADKKTISAIRQAHRRNLDAHIAVLGCYSQLHSGEVANMDGVDVVLGNIAKFDLMKFIQELDEHNVKIIHADNLDKQSPFIPTYSSGDRTRSFLKIQDGCDNFCSYCTVPFARGRSRSNTIQRTVEIAKEIARSDIKEVVLTGVNIGDFGRKNKETFFNLLQEFEKISGVDRFRISSIEPDLLTDEIIDFVAHSNKIQPHFHIPLQSGSDKILQLMGRHYDTGLFIDRVNKINTLIPFCCIAVDIIVGLPGETDDDFSDTMRLVENIDISYAHVFTYSERNNTKASLMGEKVPYLIKNKRSRLLHKLSAIKKKKYYEKNIGRQVNVLFESDNVNGFMFGFSGNYIRVKTKFDELLVNQVKEVALNKIDSDDNFIIGEKK